MLYVILGYLVFLMIYAAFWVAVMYHLKHYGFVGDACAKVARIFTILSIIIILLTFVGYTVI